MFGLTTDSGNLRVLRQSISAAQLQGIPVPIPLNIPAGSYKFVSAAIILNGTVPMNFGSPLFIFGAVSSERYAGTTLLGPAPAADYAAMFVDLDYFPPVGPESYVLSANNYIAGDCTGELIVIYTDLF